MNSQMIAHRFFYEPEARSECAGVNVHYRKAYSFEPKYAVRYYFSYSTIVAAILKDKKGKEFLIYATDKYSVTTTNQINELIHACPYETMISVPYIENHELDYIYRRSLESISKTNIEEYSRIANRERDMKILSSFDKLASMINCFSKETKALRRRKAIKEREEICTEGNEKLKAIRAEIMAKKINYLKLLQAQAEKLFKKLFPGTITEHDKIKALFQRGGLPISLEQNLSLEDKRLFVNLRSNYLSMTDKKGRKLSYMWVDEEKIHTSQGIQVPLAPVKLLIKARELGCSIVGKQIGYYTILENTRDYVKVGCHVIPEWNIKAVKDFLNI